MKAMKTLLVAALAASTIISSLDARPKHRGNKCDERGYKTIVLDVACKGDTYAQDNAEEEPHRGTNFIVNGIILPGGTIPAGDGFDLDAIEKDLGKWVCRGTWNFSFQEVLEGATPHVSTTQHFLFNDLDSILTEGPEGSHDAINRVVLGGTGKYRAVVGEVQEQFIGYNSSGFENFRMTIKIRKAPTYKW